eukprot:scaffold427_cov263-Pinguiococcus_pyrenoidosus.AAC.27
MERADESGAPEHLLLLLGLILVILMLAVAAQNLFAPAAKLSRAPIVTVRVYVIRVGRAVWSGFVEHAGRRRALHAHIHGALAPGRRRPPIQSDFVQHHLHLCIPGDRSALIVVVAAPLDFLGQVAEVLLHGDVIVVRPKQREVPHLVRHTPAVHFDDDASKAHHEGITTRSAVTLDVDEVLELGLIVDRSKVLLARVDALLPQLPRTEEGHGPTVYLLVSSIPSSKSRVQVRIHDGVVREGRVGDLLGSVPIPSFDRIRLPLGAQQRRLDALVRLRGHASSRGRSSKERDIDLVLPFAIELLQVRRSEEVSGSSVQHDVAALVDGMLEAIHIHLARGRFPVFARQNRQVGEPGAAVEAQNGCVGAVLVLGIELHIVAWHPVVAIEDEAVGLDRIARRLVEL